mgnify:CR=1 FL=1
MAQDSSEALEHLLEVGRLLSSKLEMGELLSTVLGLASRVVGSESASLLLLDEESQELYFDVALGLGPEAANFRLPVGQGVAGAVARDRKALILNDARSDPRWSPKMDEASGFVTRSILAAPMAIKGRLVGVVEAINKRDGDFNEEDLRMFEAFSSQASVAVENARLFSSLREERARLTVVFTEMTDSAILTDSEGALLLANDSARRLLAPDEKATLKTLLSGMAVEPPLEEILSGLTPSVAVEIVREEPKRLILAGRVTRTHLGSDGGSRGDGGPEGFLWILRDVTEERAKELVKQTFLALISHKLKTPLAAITGFAELLCSDLSDKLEPAQIKGLNAILTQGRKLSDLVSRLLNYVTLDAPGGAAPSKPCDVDEVLAAALKNMTEWLGERGGQVSYTPSGAMVMADPYQLREVFKNLIENAVKFDSKAERLVQVDVKSEEAEVHILIKDTGPGIPPEHLERVYSKFHQIEQSFTGQVEGWGLGLAFCKKIVEQHRGRIRLESRLGEGTTAVVTLPRAPAQ